jgi:hypothetical protein
MCLFFSVLFFGPRFALVIVWLASDLVDEAFDNFLVPVLGLVFLPFTTLVYVLVYDSGGISSIGWLLVALALLADVSSYGASARYRETYTTT